MASFTKAVSPPSINTPSIPWAPLLVTGLLSYTILCSLLRFRRKHAMENKLGYPDRASLSNMTNVDAQAIMQYLAELEFPLLYEKSVQFALFKTYGIPTISSLLVATKEFSNEATTEKRYADTSVLIQEFSAHHPKSERVLSAISRMNYLHGHYQCSLESFVVLKYASTVNCYCMKQADSEALYHQRAGKISNDDMLYTLSVFITEPISWIGKYEWRFLTDMEICAIGTFWKSIGDSMGIKYTDAFSHTNWINGLEFTKDITRWAEDYEKSYMVPAASNRATADPLMPLLLWYLPLRLYESATQAMIVLMGERLRKAMLYDSAPKTYHTAMNITFAIRKFVLRHLTLPRPSYLNVRQITDKPDPKSGRFFMASYLRRPWYNKASFWNRWGPEALFTWAVGGTVPGTDGAKWISGGYVFEEVGPSKFMGKGVAEMEDMKERLRAERPVGCPFVRM
ncbi:hypothetical protein BJ878DRAFT_479053 [Calycina marina]|uniref:ER-bound oxygenase mpaB/mpaB'/Rubber oxygenase catalytic domain-containing protein n=1 Tax=Calycina marina TaxID=1763456 RepID=A0A9P8CFY0_9HELO|nr:hypothetical protein BJ878DRAFT_479053 [Calycina marina]